MRPLRAGAAALMAITVGACAAAHGPILDTGSKPEAVGGTIAGIVRVAGSNQPLSGRKVTATNAASGARYEASTASNGGYTLKVPTGRYRLDVELRPGESLAGQPDETDINRSDLDADRDFIVAIKAPE